MNDDPYYQDDHVTIYHADCLDLIDRLEFDVVVSDPPYGSDWTAGIMTTRYNANGPNLRKPKKVTGDESVALRDAMLGMIGKVPSITFGTWKVPRPGNTDRVLIWNKAKASPGPVNHPWFTSHEEIYLMGSGWTGGPMRSVITTTENRSRAATESGHPTSKPVPLMRVLIDKCPDGVILDPFMGSGSTLRAAKDLGRTAIGIEIEERYCEIAATRLGQEVLDFGCER